MPQTGPLNPYASPRLLAATPNASDGRLRLARRVRWQVRAVSMLWIVAGSVVLGEPMTMFSGTSLMDENASMLSLLLCVLGVCVWFRWRWAIWLGTFIGLVGVAHCAFRLRHVIADYEVRLVAEVAELAVKTLLLNCAAFFVGFLAGAHVLWRIRALGKAGIPYRFDPSLPEGSYEYDGQPIDAVQVVKLARRWDRLAWMWTAMAVLVSTMVFPCLLLLKEETYQVTAGQWRVAIGLQLAGLVAGLGLFRLAIAIRRVSRPAALIGLAFSYFLLLFSAVNLALPPIFFPAFARQFPDMACSLFSGLAVAAFILAAQAHLALWSAGRFQKLGLPVTIRLEQLTPAKF